MKARPHWLRPTLRTWLAEAADAPHEIAGAMLGHATGSSAAPACRRTDFLEQRRARAERWADHVTGGAGNVVALAGAR